MQGPRAAILCWHEVPLPESAMPMASKDWREEGRYFRGSNFFNLPDEFALID